MPHTRTTLTAAIILVAGALASARAAAQSTIIKVTDGDDHKPVPYAWVVVHSGTTAIANERGEVDIGKAARKTITVDVHRIGYQPWSGKLTLPDSATTQTVELARVAQPLAGVTVSASAVQNALESEGFYTRWLEKQQGQYRNATFIGPEMIEARKASLTTDLLDRVLELRFHRDSKGVLAVIGTGRRPAGTQIRRDRNDRNDPSNELAADACFMNVLIDGGPVCPAVGCHYVFPGDPPGSTNDDHSIDINKAISPSHVAGIEVYPRQDGMPRLVRDLWNGCGIVVIWSTTGK